MQKITNAATDRPTARGSSSRCAKISAANTIRFLVHWPGRNEASKLDAEDRGVTSVAPASPKSTCGSVERAMARGRAAADERLHLAEREHIAAPRDQIDLAFAHAVVAFHDAPAGALEMPCGEVFASLSESLAPVG